MIILGGIVGSHASGLNVEGSDTDMMWVHIPPARRMVGLDPDPDNIQSKRDGKDHAIYSLRDFCKLAAAGNPTLISFLYLPDNCYIHRTQAGVGLLTIRAAFRNNKAGYRFSGYLASQLRALRGERRPTVSRPELVKEKGYDTKFAMHALRLGYQGVEYLTTGRITLPVPEQERAVLMAVRNGEFPLQHVRALIEVEQQKLEHAIQTCTFRVDRAKINRYLEQTHLKHWG